MKIHNVSREVTQSLCVACNIWVRGEDVSWFFKNGTFVIKNIEYNDNEIPVSIFLSRNINRAGEESQRRSAYCS